MASIRLSDLRKFQICDIAEADKCFALLARIEISINARKAAAEKKISDIKAKLASDIEDESKEHESLVSWLDKYIRANKDRFVKPRMRQTEWGKYGLRKASKLEITDEAAVIKCSDELGLSLYEVTKKISKKAVAEAIEDEETITGAKVISGDVANYSVDKKLFEPGTKSSNV